MATTPDRPEPIDPSQGIEGKNRAQPDRSAFEKHMKTPQSPTAPSQTSPMDLAQKTNAPSSTPTLASLTSQVNNADATLQTLQGQLKNMPKVNMKKQHQTLLDEKLQQANRHIREASAKMGLPVGDGQKDLSKMGPVKKFLNYVADGQKQILEAKKKLETMKTDSQLNPSDLILVQIKLSQAQQELEYSSILLAKVVDMLKQLINIQI